MTKWEYLVVDDEGAFNAKWEGEKITLIDFLNKKGKQGWELVQGPTHGFPQCIFKRLINQ